MKGFINNNWPYGLVLASCGVITSGVIMATVNPGMALTTVGSSNLAMVLALSGASALTLSMIVWHWKKSLVMRGGISVACTLDNKTLLPNLITLSVVLAAGYYATHIAIAEAHFAGLSAWESLGAQSVISFGFGCVIGYLYGLSLFKINNTNMSHAQGATYAIGGGLICAAATTVGPMLTEVMQAAAADSTQRIAAELLIGISIASLAMILHTLSFRVEDVSQKFCGKQKPEPPLFTP